MDVTITPKKETSEVELHFTVPAVEFTPYLERAAKKLSKQTPLPGFRPGKATLPAASEAFGQDRLVHEATDRAIPHFFVQAILDHDINAIGRPTISVTASSPTDGLRFTATVAVLPDVTLPDPATITATKRTMKVTDDEVQQELNYLAKTRSTFLEVARPAAVGDTVTVDFKVSMNGAVMDGGESKNHPVHIGEGHFVPDFEKKITGITGGDTREFTIAFPDDYTRQELHGKTANVWVKAHQVQKRIIPPLDDAFATKLGKFENLAHLKTELTKNMQREKEQREAERFFGELSENLADRAQFGHIPAVLIDREIDRRLEEFSQMLTYQGKTVDDYLAQHYKTLAGLREELRPASAKAVKVGLALRAFADQQEINVEDGLVQAKVDAYLKRFASTKAARAQVDLEDLKTSLASTLRNQKSLERLAELAQVKTIPAEAKK